MDNSELDKIVPYFVKYKHKKRLYYQKILHPVLASQDEISYNKRNRLSIEGKTVTGQKRGSIWKNTAGILAPAVILALFLAGCGVKNENTAAAAVSETVSVPEPAIPGDAGEQQAFCLVTSDLHFTLSDVSSVYTLGKYTPELARAFAEEMLATGTVDLIRAEAGNLRYEYYLALEDPETVLLIDSWADQAAIDAHHASPMMATIAALREKYDLHMTVERFAGIDENPEDRRFIRS